MPTPHDVLEYVQLSAANTIEPLLSLNDEVHFFLKAGTFNVIPGTKLPVEAVNQRRWGGSHQVGETTENGRIEWTAGVAGVTEQECLEKVEVLLARLEANPFRSLILWEPPGAEHATLYEARGTGTWTPQYESLTFEGAQLFLFQVSIPVAPLAEGLPEKVLTSGSTVLPAVFSIAGIKGDAPAKAEVSVETGSASEELIGGIEPEDIAIDGTFIYWVEGKTGFIGRAKLNGSAQEPKWLKTEGNVFSVAVDAGHIYWSDWSTNAIGRATIAGGTIQKTWITGASSPRAIAVNGSNIYWINAGTAAIARATIAGTGANPTFITGATLVPSEGIALDSTYVYWAGDNGVVRATLAGEEAELLIPLVHGAEGLAVTSEFIYFGREASESIGRAAINGEEVNQNWVTIPPELAQTQLAVNASFLYWMNRGFAREIFRAAIKGPPVFALLGWASKPTSGLAPAPFGIFEAASAEGGPPWVLASHAGAKGQILSTSTGKHGAAWWPIDPATMAPDSFTGELAVEVWARVLLGPSAAPANFTLSTRPFFGAAYGSTRYSDEWGSSGRPVEAPLVAEKFRLTRLGTLHLLVNPLAPQIWRLWVEATFTGSGTWGLDYLIAVPVFQRACSPSGKPFGPSYPPFLTSILPGRKTIKSDLSALISKPGEYGHPDHGLAGQMIELPPGEASLLVKLSSMVPDAEVSSPATEQVSHEGKVSVIVTPRYYLARTA